MVVPHLQNPLGSIMPDAHQARLVEFCANHGLPLIEDDTYSALADGDAPLKALKSWDKTGNVIHCASLHKVLAPGLRLGWMSAGPVSYTHLDVYKRQALRRAFVPVRPHSLRANSTDRAGPHARTPPAWSSWLRPIPFATHPCQVRASSNADPP